MRVDLNAPVLQLSPPGLMHSFVLTQEAGKRISALAVWQPQQGFDYGLVVGGFNTQRFVQLMIGKPALRLSCWQAQVKLQ